MTENDQRSWLIELRAESPVESRRGFSLVELLVVIAILGLLAAMTLSAIARVRTTAERISCQNKLRQISLASILFHDERQTFPPGHRSRYQADRMPFSGWTLSILPYLDQKPILDRALFVYPFVPIPFFNPPHLGLSTIVPQLLCPSDDRVSLPQVAQRSRYAVAFTSFLGVSGINLDSRDGILFQDSHVCTGDIQDGMSNTLMIGERPPSPDFQFGWWYAGKGQRDTGSGDLTLSVREVNVQEIGDAKTCPYGPYQFQKARGLEDPCGMFHFWSLHPGGANFAMCDGSVHFLSYSVDKILPALATRAGNEAVELP